MFKKYLIHLVLSCLILLLGNALVSMHGAMASDFQLVAREDDEVDDRDSDDSSGRGSDDSDDDDDSGYGYGIDDLFDDRNDDNDDDDDDDSQHGYGYGYGFEDDSGHHGGRVRFEDRGHSGRGAKLGEMCGGIAAFQCREPLECQLDGDFPDAGGICVHPLLERDKSRSVLASVLWGNFDPDLMPTAVNISGKITIEGGTLQGKRNLLLEAGDEITMMSETEMNITTMTGPFQDGAMLHIKGDSESVLVINLQNIQSRVSLQQLYKEGRITLPLGTDGMELRVRLIKADQLKRILQPRFQQNLCVQNLALDLDEDTMNQLTEKIGADKKLFDRVCKRYLHESKKSFGQKLGNFAKGDDLNTLLDELDILDEYDSLLEMSQQNPKLAQLFEKLRKHRLHGEVVKELKDLLKELKDSNIADEKITKLENMFDETVERSRLAKFRDGLLRFRDVDDDDDSWFHDFVERMAQKGIVKGFTGSDGQATGEFRPGNQVTRSEALKMVLEAIIRDILDEKPTLASVQAHWAAKYWKWAIDSQLDFAVLADQPDATATRGDIIRMIMQSAGIIAPDRDENCSFPDLDSSDPRANDICYAQSLGIVSGDSDTGNFRPNDPINRAEVSKIINLLLDLWELPDPSINVSDDNGSNS